MIRIWNRAAGREETETVAGDRLLRWSYEGHVGPWLTRTFLIRPWFSRLLGTYQSSALSRGAVRPFVERYGIDMAEYEPGPYRSFNDFFVRRFRPGARDFCAAADRMPAFAEGRYLAHEHGGPETRVPVKGAHLSPWDLLDEPRLAERFAGGPLLVVRLCPVDYHRFHFPDAGETVARYPVSGALHSVSPIALQRDPRILIGNERWVSLLDTRNFGRLAYVEIGALCVGRIVHSHPLECPFRRGDEKGYFLFGASTVVLLGEPGAWLPDADLLEQTRDGRETLVRLGEPVARVAAR